VTAALVSWNGCGALMPATLGVATVVYAHFAFLNIPSPLISGAMALLGIRMP
jgi:NhaC family Na+:H+ antiporter